MDQITDEETKKKYEAIVSYLFDDATKEMFVASNSENYTIKAGYAHIDKAIEKANATMSWWEHMTDIDVTALTNAWKSQFRKEAEAYGIEYGNTFSNQGSTAEEKDVVKPENLVDGPTAAMYKAAEGNINQKDRDVSKSDVKKGIEYAIYGAENQTSINRIMPVRIMGYDYASYDRSINKLKAQNRKEKKEANYAEEIHPGQKVFPVVTLVLYFGSKRWDGPKTLHDMLDIQEELKPYVPNYSINLIEVAFLPDSTIKSFKSDFRLVAEFFKAKRLGKLKEWDYNKKKIIHMAELMEFFATFTNNKRFEEIKEAMDTLEFTAAEAAGYEAWKTKVSE